MLLGMDLGMAIRTHQDTLVQFGLHAVPRLGVAFRSDPEFFLTVGVVKGQCVKAPTVTTPTTASAFVAHRFSLQVLAPLMDEELDLAARTTKPSLPSHQNFAAPMPNACPVHSRLLYH
jgi:hypothetical protein